MSALDDAIAAEMQHPSGTMDDPLTAAMVASLLQDPLQPSPAEACSELLADMDADVHAATSLPTWFWLPALVALLLAPLPACGDRPDPSAPPAPMDAVAHTEAAA